MKLTSFYASLLLANLSAIALAEILFDPLPLRLYTGDSCELHWSTDTDYVLELLLVQRFDEGDSNGWTAIETVFKDRPMLAGSESYKWTVPSVKEHDVSYSLWLSGMDSPSTGYANITNRFQIKSDQDHESGLLSLSQIGGVFVGVTVCLSLFAAATVALLRFTRQTACAGCLRPGMRPCEAPDVGRSLDEETEAYIAGKAEEVSRYEHRR